MAETKPEPLYAHLIKPLPIGKGPGGANAQELVWMFGNQLENFSLNFALGRYQETGVWHPWSGPHVHPTYNECLLFFGHDTDNLDYLGAEMEIALGKEQEKHTFNTPSIVILPLGLPHCPLVTRKVEKPFGHGHIILGPDDKVDWWPKESEPVQTTGTNYAHLIKKLPINKAPTGTNTQELTWLMGDQLEEFNLSIAFGLCNETGQWYQGHGAHAHPYDECLIFFGHDGTNLTYLGAEITIDMGKEHEKHTINVPTVVTIPRGLPHLPIVVNKVEKPFGFIMYALGPRYEAPWIS